MTDADLEEALKQALGIFGGRCGPGELHMTYQGASLRIRASWEIHNHVREKPLFSGPATIAMAREVYGIPDPAHKQMSLF